MERKRNRLQQLVDFEHDATTKANYQKELDKLIADYQKTLDKRALQDKKDALKEQQDLLKEEHYHLLLLMKMASHILREENILISQILVI